MEKILKKRQPVKAFYLNPNPEAILQVNSPYRHDLIQHTFANGADLYQYLKSGHLAEVLLLAVHDEVFSFIELLQKDTTLKKLPVVLISTEVNAELVEKACTLGIDDIFTADKLDQNFLLRLNYLVRKYYLLNKRPQRKSVDRLEAEILKRNLDLLKAGTEILISAPVMALVALLLKLESKAPIFALTPQTGAENKLFWLYNFRTTRTKTRNNITVDNTATSFSSEGNRATDTQNNLDPPYRPTLVGRFIRRTRLEALPQLFNILRGDIPYGREILWPLYESKTLSADDYLLRFTAPEYQMNLWRGTKSDQKLLAEKEVPEPEIVYAPKRKAWLDWQLTLKTIPVLSQKENN